MPKKILLFAGVVVLFAAIIFYFINYTISIGLCVGYIFSLIYIGMLTFSVHNLDDDSSNKILLVLSSILRLFVLAFPMMVAGLYPQFMNIYSVVCGEIMFKISLYLAAFLHKGGL